MLPVTGASCRMSSQRGGDKSPCELRFGSKFDGPLIPFGCLVDYWNGPRKKNKEGLRFDPTPSPGLFLGYAIHPEFVWRKEFMVVPTKDLIENGSNGTASILRVLKIHKPDETQYPLQGRTTFGKDDPGLSEALGNQEPTLENQDAEMVDDEEAQRDDFQLSTAHAVHDETWLPFMRYIKDREGWYEYADSHVNVRRDCDHYVSPIGKFSVEDYPYRTTCHRKDEPWFIFEQNFILCPKHKAWDEAIAPCKVMLTIFHKNALDLRERTEEEIRVEEVIPGDDPPDKGSDRCHQSINGSSRKKSEEMTFSFTVPTISRQGGTKDQANQWTFLHSCGNLCLLKPEEKPSENNK